MRRPLTPDEVLELHRLSVADPARFIEIANDWITTNPADPHAYFDRHFALVRLGQTQLALEDINRSIELNPSPIAFQARGDLHRRLGDYPLAARDYAQGEAIGRAAMGGGRSPLALPGGYLRTDG